jgi:hypothetical protein
MIRRGIALSERESVWLLISQVEHARISGELTQNSKEHFSPEVVQAITHHDDGWAEWETAPKLNPEIGGPYSFLEMPLAESLVIWDASIAAARKFGPLAGFIVAGHFYNLLSDSENAQQPAGIAWLAAKRKSRTVWLDEWVRENPSHTIEGAKRAQHTLLTADLFSLWLCCDAPIAGDDTGLLEQSPMRVRLQQLLGQVRFSLVGFGRRHATLENPMEALAWVIAVEPYPFQTSHLSLSITAVSAPVARYTTWYELMAASQPIELRWRLVPPGAPSDEPARTIL